ncbi:MAG: YfiR family protein [Bacteroidia bacterium]
MRKLIVILISFFLLSADIVDYSFYQKDDTNSKIKAAFLYSFTRYFEWPSSTSGNFVIAIHGDSPNLLAELNRMASTKMVGNQKMEILHVKDVKDVHNANILYILPDKSGFLADAVSKFKGKGTLIITEKAGLAKVGAAINFVIEENKQQFELNKTSAIKAGLKVSSSLESKALRLIN